MTAHRPKPAAARMSRLLARICWRYSEHTVEVDHLRYWLANSNDTDEDFQAMAEYNAEDGHWSVARFCRLMCFTSKTQRRVVSSMASDLLREEVNADDIYEPQLGRFPNKHAMNAKENP